MFTIKYSNDKDILSYFYSKTKNGYPLASRQQYLSDKCLLLYVQS